MRIFGIIGFVMRDETGFPMAPLIFGLGGLMGVNCRKALSYNY